MKDKQGWQQGGKNQGTNKQPTQPGAAGQKPQQPQRPSTGGGIGGGFGGGRKEEDRDTRK